MADKKIVIVLGKEALNAEISQKLMKKGIVCKNYEEGNLLQDLASLDYAEKTTAQALNFAGSSSLFVIENASNADLDLVLEKVDRHTLLVYVQAKTLIFSGTITDYKAGESNRKVLAQDILPTCAYYGDLEIDPKAEGAIIYQIFKDPNFKVKEITKLKEAILSMETALERGNRQPWDKHDCA